MPSILANRVSLPFLIGAGSYHTLYLIPSEDNLGDDGTRGAALRSVVEVLPHIEEALEDRAPLFDEDLLLRFFQRGIPKNYKPGI